MKLKDLHGLFDSQNIEKNDRVTVDTLSNDFVRQYTWVFDHNNICFLALPCKCENEQQFWRKIEPYCDKQYFNFFKNQMKFIPTAEMITKQQNEWKGLYAHSMSLQDFGNQVKDYFERTNKYYSK